MTEQIINLLPLYNSSRFEFFEKMIELLRNNGAVLREDIDATPIKDIEGLIKEINQYVIYKDIDLLFAAIQETAVYLGTDKE